MAQVPVRISATVVDEWGIEASAPFYGQANDASTIAAMETELSAFLTALDATTDGYIKSARLTLFPSLPTGIKTAAAAGSRVEQTGLLGFSASGTSKRYTADIPALSNGATVMSGDRIVLTGVDPIGVLVALLTTVGTVLKWCNAHNQQITQFIDALVAYHKKRKQLQRSSFEL